MEHLDLILKNTSLWEVTAFIVVLYLLFHPSLLRRITKFKVGDLEIELNALKEQVARSEGQIAELEVELESERRLFDDLLENFDPNAPLKELVETRKSIKNNAKNLEEIESVKQYLVPGVSPEDLYVAAVATRERRPTVLIPDIVRFLSEIATDKNLGGYRLNTIWTLTSALHLSLLSAIRDSIPPMPEPETLLMADNMLRILEKNPRVQKDRPDNPMKGIRGPINHCRTWVKKGFALYESNNNA